MNNFYYSFLVDSIFDSNNILFCHKCSFGESFPPIPENQLNDFNENYYSHPESMHSKPLMTPVFIEKLLYRPRYISQFSLLSNHINLSTINTILDIGSGEGGSYFAAKKIGINAEYYCVEKDKISRKFLEKLDIKIFSSISLLLNEKKFHNYFNVIILSHILEHISFETLTLLLSQLQKLLSHNGKLLIEVPNEDFSIDKELKQSNHAPHMLFFSNSSLKSILINNNYKIFYKS